MTQTPATDPSSIDQHQLVRDAASLGWALTELLSCCFLLQQLQAAEKTALKQVWAGDSMRILPPMRGPRQHIYSGLFHIRSLAHQLNLDKLKIEPDVLDSLQIAPDTLAKLKRDANEPDKVCYLDAIEENVIKLCSDDFDPAKGSFTYFRGQINGLLLYWDTLIYEQLQAMSAGSDEVYSYLNAYLVGRGFATIRWDLPLDEPVHDRAEMQHELVNIASLHRLCDHIQLMTPSLPKFAATALAYSATRWGNAFLQNKVNGESSLQLQDQAEIWQSLLTGRRDPITYIAPSSTALRYTLKVSLFCLPFILLSILLAIGILSVILFLVGIFGQFIAQHPNFPTIVTTVTVFVGGGVGAGFSFFVILAQRHMVAGIWGWLSPKLLDAANQSSTTIMSNTQNALLGNAQQPSLVTMLWDTAQQEVINKATYIPMPSVAQRMRTALARTPGAVEPFRRYLQDTFYRLSSRSRRP